MNFLGSEHDDLVEEADRDLVEESKAWDPVEAEEVEETAKEKEEKEEKEEEEEEAPGAFRPRLR